MTLHIMNSGASDEEVARGVSAAGEYFRSLGVSAEECAKAAQSRADEGPHDADFAILWDFAEAAAFSSAFTGWTQWPEAATLEII